MKVLNRLLKHWENSPDFRAFMVGAGLSIGAYGLGYLLGRSEPCTDNEGYLLGRLHEARDRHD